MIPAMDYIEQVMTGYKQNATYDPAIWMAIGFGKMTLNKYYSLMTVGKTSIRELRQIRLIKK